MTTTHTSNSPVTFATQVFCRPPLSAVLLRKLTIIAIWTQCNMTGSMQPWGVIQKSHSNAETVQKFLWTRTKSTAICSRIRPHPWNEVLVLISLESRCFARFRPGEHDVRKQRKTSTLSLLLLCFRKEYFVFFTKLYILFQNAGYIIVHFLFLAKRRAARFIISSCITQAS